MPNGRCYDPVNVDDKIIIRAPFHDEAPTGAIDIVIKPTCHLEQVIMILHG